MTTADTMTNYHMAATHVANNTHINSFRDPRSKKGNFRTKFFSEFQDIFVSFMRLKTQKMHVFLCSQILISQADQYCSHKNVTKAMLHIKQRTVTTENSAGHSMSAI